MYFILFDDKLILYIIEFDFIDFVLFSINDVRQVLPQYKDKDIPSAYAMWEEQWKKQQQMEWENKLKQPKKGLASLVSAFGSAQIVCEGIILLIF
jgi:hypothetical protein